MVQRWVTLLLYYLDVLSPVISGFRRQRRAEDAIMGHFSSLEEARACKHAAHIAFVDIH